MNEFNIMDGGKELLFRFNGLQIKDYRKVILFANKITDLNHFDLPVAGLFDFNQASLRKGNLYPNNFDINKIELKNIVNYIASILDPQHEDTQIALNVSNMVKHYCFWNEFFESDIVNILSKNKKEIEQIIVFDNDEILDKIIKLINTNFIEFKKQEINCEQYYDNVKLDFTEDKVVNILLDIDDLCEQSDKQSDFTEVSANIAHQFLLMFKNGISNEEDALKYTNIIKNFISEQNLNISRQWQNRYKEIKSIILSNIELFDEVDKTFKNLNNIFSNEKLLELYNFKSPIIEEKIIANYIINFCSQVYEELKVTSGIDFTSIEVSSTGK